MKKIFLLLVFSTMLFASHFDTQSVLSDWRLYATFSVLISVMASALLLMLSRLLDLKQLETVFKAEMVFAGSTVFIMLVLIVLLDQGEHVLLIISQEMAQITFKDASIVFSDDFTLTDVAKFYMSPMAICAQRAMEVLYTGSIPIEVAASQYQEMFMSEQAGGSGAKPLSEVIKTLTKTITFYMLGYYIIVHLLNFIKHYALFFLSVGIVLRAFPPTRGAGAYLMAIVIGLYFVFPFVFIFTSTVASTPMQSLIKVDQNEDDLDRKIACNVPNIPEPPDACGAQQRAKVFENKMWLDAHGSDYKNLIIDIFGGKFTRQLVTSICLIPIVALTALITFVLSTTNLFGGQIPEIGRGLIKLI